MCKTRQAKPFTNQARWPAERERLAALLGDDNVEAALRQLLADQESLELERAELRDKLAEVEQSRDRFVDLFDEAPIAYLAFDRAGIIQRINREARRIFGREGRYLVGRTLRSLIDNGDRDAWLSHLSQCHQGASEPTISEVRLLGDPGKPVQLVTPSSIDPAQPGLYLTIVHDLSERERTERLLRESELFHELTGAIEECFWLFDWRERRFVYVSPAYEQILGLSARALYDDPRAWEAAIHADERGAVAQRFYFYAGKEPFEQKCRIVRPDGQVRRIASRNFPIRDNAGRVYRIASVTRDVTDQEATEHRLYQREQELAKIGRIGLMGEMASGVAHELNQPLSAISTYAQGCVERTRETPEVPDWLREAIGEIHQQAERAGRIIHSLRRFARMGEPERGFVAAAGLIEEVTELTRADLRRQGAQVEHAISANLPRLFVGAVEIEQVLVNLLHNASQAMEEADCQGRRIVLGAEKVSDQELRLTVSDTGPGLSDQQLELMFEPFYTTKEQGLGIGLNICQTIVEHHGGRIWAERNEAGGLCFHLLLPTEHATATEEAPADIAGGDEPGGDESGGREPGPGRAPGAMMTPRRQLRASLSDMRRVKSGERDL